MTFGCSPGSDPPADEPVVAPSPSVSLSFLQYRSDEGTRRALLRVTNHDDEVLSPTGIGVDWVGYGGRYRQDYDTTIAPGQTLDLRMSLPPPVCADGSGPAHGLVEVGATTARSRLDPFGQAILRQVWRRSCDKEYVGDRLGVALDDTWRRAGVGRSSYLVGRLDLTRRGGSAEVEVARLRGSVMFDLRLAEPSVLRSGSEHGWYPVELRPLRCDEHALGQSSQTFAWRSELRFHDDELRTVPLVPSLRTQVRANALLERACR
ncbi:MAG: hypothetical protein AVDCRST_MAG72-2469 [uncultured Nocardioidaceae bacterium]|uniref:Uncharacterized protein n=1 Tax=uncultured Nocardioidaceae bacterium TaxID=253824 RepID=A0A6J4MLP7_9ACTN|nr:MAG: hypothetical protein AVDCRST_MAG72-2469 [uncultured Nocardioidaceae bacterium]